ncbi:MAG TPA: rhomboid family intramembrane serine protease [Mycobacteriales bacterium]|nr:rhomboid family intramembrane serine protease [Mycobacteriales bacterium]
MVIPVHDRNPARRPAVITWSLIIINVVVFLISPAATVPGTSTSSNTICHQQAFFNHWGAVPTELMHNRALNETVGSSPAPGYCLRVPRTYDKTPVLSAITSMFVHGGWAHLLGNMLFLLIFGNNVEDRLGRIRFALFYLAVGMASAYGFAATEANSTTTLIGASGAIAGVLGAYLVMFPRAKVTSLVPFLLFLPVRLPAWVVLAGWFLLQAFYAQGEGLGGGGGVAYLVHVIGFILGALVGLTVRKPPARAVPPNYPPLRW